MTNTYNYDQHPVARSLKEFRDTFEASNDPALWLKLIEEELNEFDEALQNLLKEFIDITYVYEGAYQVAVEQDAHDLPLNLFNRVQVAQAVINRFVNPETLTEAFKRVHESNMSKLGDDGKVLRREDGKVLKSDQYKPADLTDLIGTLAG